MIEEETEELYESIKDNDLVGIADALGDLLYVVIGAALEYGIPLDAVVDEIHKSNMEKIWDDGEVHYREDGKVMKPPTWKAPNIKGVLDGAI